MAVRQYIGARYVPLYMGDWDNTRNYEPLSIVTDANGNSYTSLKDVPAGTPLNNRDFWVQTSSFSGAVDVLRRDVNQAQSDISGLQGAMSTAQDDISDLQDDVSYLRRTVSSQGESIEAIENFVEMDRDKILFISDSYGGRKNASDKSFSQLFTEYTGVPSDLVWVGSTGFSQSNTFKNVLDAYQGDRSKIKEIWVVGGANDIAGSYADILAGMDEFKQLVDSDFGGVPVYIFMCGTIFSNHYSVRTRGKFYENYTRAAGVAGLGIIVNSQYVLHNTYYLEGDYVHPNTRGIDYIGQMLSIAYRTKSADVETDFDTTISLYSGYTMPDVTRIQHIHHTMHNGVGSLNANGGMLLDFGLSANDPDAYVKASGSTNALKVGIFSNSLFNNGGSSFDSASGAPARITLENGAVYMGSAMIAIDAKDLYVVLLVPDAAAAGHYVRDVKIQACYLPMDAR